MNYPYARGLLFLTVLAFVLLGAAGRCSAQTVAPIQDLSYTLDDTKGNSIVLSWSLDADVQMATIRGTAIDDAANTITINPITVKRSDPNTVSIPSHFRQSLMYGGPGATFAGNVKTATLTVEAQGTVSGVATTFRSNARIDFDMVRNYFSSRQQTEQNKKDLADLKQQLDDAVKARDLFQSYATNYPRLIDWRPKAYNNVVVIRATSTYPAQVQAVATALDASGDKKITATTSIPALTATDITISGLDQNKDYRIELVEIQSQAAGPKPPPITFKPANQNVRTSNLPEARIRFVSSSGPVNVKNAQVRFPLEVQAAQQMKIVISETPPGVTPVERFSQTLQLKPECQDTPDFRPCTIVVPFEAKEGKAYAVRLEPLAAFQSSNSDQSIPSSFTGLNAVLAKTVVITFGKDSLNFSADSTDNIKMQVQAQANASLVSWDQLKSSKNPNFPIQYAALPSQPADGLQLTISLKADDPTGREQTQTVTLKVDKPTTTDSGVQKELRKFGTALAQTTTPASNDTDKKLSLKSAFQTGLGVLLRVLFPVIP